MRLNIALKCYCSQFIEIKIRIQFKTEVRSNNVFGLIRPKKIFNLKSNLCQLVFNVCWGHTWCFGALFHCFVV